MSLYWMIILFIRSVAGDKFIDQHSFFYLLCFLLRSELSQKTKAIDKRCCRPLAGRDIAVDSVEFARIFRTIQILFKARIARSSFAFQDSDAAQNHRCGTDSAYTSPRIELIQHGFAYTLMSIQI